MIYLNITFDKPAATGRRRTRQMRRNSYKPARKRLCFDSKARGELKRIPEPGVYRNYPAPIFGQRSDKNCAPPGQVQQDDSRGHRRHSPRMTCFSGSGSESRFSTRRPWNSRAECRTDVWDRTFRNVIVSAVRGHPKAQRDHPGGSIAGIVRLRTWVAASSGCHVRRASFRGRGRG